MEYNGVKTDQTPGIAEQELGGLGALPGSTFARDTDDPSMVAVGDATGALRRRADWQARCDEIESMIRREDKWSRMHAKVYEANLVMAMAVADFPLAFGDVLARSLIARYEALPRRLDPIFDIGTNPDFRTANVFRMDGTTKRLQQVGEGGTYLEAARYETRWQVTLVKYGKRFALTWEAFVNDDLGFFDGVPADMADSAVNTESYLQTSTFWDADGPLDAYFADASEGQGGVSSNAFSIANLGTARAELRGTLANMRNYQGEPYNKNPRYIVHGPTLTDGVLQALNSTEVERITDTTPAASAAAYYQVGTRNVANLWQLVPIEDPWIDVVCTTGTIAATTWGLFADRAAAVFRRLRGREAPELFMKTPNATRLGGGTVSPYDGSFDDDTMQYKVRIACATATTDMRNGWGSDGQ
jgi:hypothetical protein